MGNLKNKDCISRSSAVPSTRAAGQELGLLKGYT